MAGSKLKSEGAVGGRAKKHPCGALVLVLLVMCGLGFSAAEGANANGDGYTVAQLIEIARRDNLGLASVRAQALAAQAGIITARALPNPEVEVLVGQAQAAAPGIASGSSNLIGISQRIENSALRHARGESAALGAESARAYIAVAENDLIALVKVRFYELLRRQEELAATREDFALTEQIRDRIRVRVRVGEAPRFDLARAETEVSVATKQVEAAILRVAQAKASLRQLVGTGLPGSFEVKGELDRHSPPTDYTSARELALSANPELRRAVIDGERAGRQLDLERAAVMPSFSLRMQQDRDWELRTLRVGIAVSLPLLDRRQGPISEARAQLLRARTDVEARRFELSHSFELAWKQYQVASGQIQALEGGILAQSRSVMEIAEAAYRFGERGILEYLDAQRQFRLARNELISARYELQVARAELDRLSGQEVREK